MNVKDYKMASNYPTEIMFQHLESCELWHNNNRPALFLETISQTKMAGIIRIAEMQEQKMKDHLQMLISINFS